MYPIQFQQPLDNLDIGQIAASYASSEDDPKINQFLPYFENITEKTPGGVLLSYLEPLIATCREAGASLESIQDNDGQQGKKTAAAKPAKEQQPQQVFLEQQDYILEEQQIVSKSTSRNTLIRYHVMLRLFCAICGCRDILGENISLEQLYYITELAQRCLFSVQFVSHKHLLRQQFLGAMKYIQFITQCCAYFSEVSRYQLNDEVLAFNSGAASATNRETDIQHVLEYIGYCFSVLNQNYQKVVESYSLSQRFPTIKAPQNVKQGKGEQPQDMRAVYQIYRDQALFMQQVYQFLKTVSPVLFDIMNLNQRCQRIKRQHNCKIVLKMAEDLLQWVSGRLEYQKTLMLDLCGIKKSGQYTEDMNQFCEILFGQNIDLRQVKYYELEERANKLIKETTMRLIDSLKVVQLADKAYIGVCMRHIVVCGAEDKQAQAVQKEAKPPEQQPDLFDINIDRFISCLDGVYGIHKKVLPYQCDKRQTDNYCIIQMLRNANINSYAAKPEMIGELVGAITQQVAFYNKEVKQQLNNLDVFRLNRNTTMFNLSEDLWFNLKMVQTIMVLCNSVGGSDKKAAIQKQDKGQPQGADKPYMQLLQTLAQASGVEMLSIAGLDQEMQNLVKLNYLNIFQLLKQVDAQNIPYCVKIQNMILLCMIRTVTQPSGAVDKSVKYKEQKSKEGSTATEKDPQIKVENLPNVVIIDQMLWFIIANMDAIIANQEYSDELSRYLDVLQSGGICADPFHINIIRTVLRQMGQVEFYQFQRQYILENVSTISSVSAREKAFQSVVQANIFVNQLVPISSPECRNNYYLLTEVASGLRGADNACAEQKVMLQISTKGLMHVLLLQIVQNYYRQGSYDDVIRMVFDNVDYGNLVLLKLLTRSLFQTIISADVQGTIKKLSVVHDSCQLLNRQYYDLIKYTTEQILSTVALFRRVADQCVVDQFVQYIQSVLTAYSQKIEENQQEHNNTWYVVNCFRLNYAIFVLTGDTHADSNVRKYVPAISALASEKLAPIGEAEEIKEQKRPLSRGKTKAEQSAGKQEAAKIDGQNLMYLGLMVAVINYHATSSEASREEQNSSLRVLGKIIGVQDGQEDSTQTVLGVLQQVQSCKLQIADYSHDQNYIQQVIQQLCHCYRESQNVSYLQLLGRLLIAQADAMRVVSLPFKTFGSLLNLFVFIMTRDQTKEVLQLVSLICGSIAPGQLDVGKLYGQYKALYYNYDVMIVKDVGLCIKDAFQCIKIAYRSQYVSEGYFYSILNWLTSSHQQIIALHTHLQTQYSQGLFAVEVKYIYAVLLAYHYFYIGSYVECYRYAQILYAYMMKEDFAVNDGFLEVNLRILFALLYQPGCEAGKQARQSQIDLLEQFLENNKDSLQALYVRYHLFKESILLYVQADSKAHTTIFEQKYLQLLLCQFVDSDIVVDQFVRFQVLLSQQQHPSLSPMAMNESLGHLDCTLQLMCQDLQTGWDNVWFLVFVLVASQSYYYEDVVSQAEFSQGLACRFLCKGRKLYLAYRLIKFLIRQGGCAAPHDIDQHQLRECRVLLMTLIEQLLYLYRTKPNEFVIQNQLLRTGNFSKQIADRMVSKYLLEVDQGAAAQMDQDLAGIVNETAVRLNVYSLSKEFIGLGRHVLSVEPATIEQQDGQDGLQEYLAAFNLEQGAHMEDQEHCYIYTLYLSVLGQNNDNILDLAGHIGGRGITKRAETSEEQQPANRPQSSLKGKKGGEAPKESTHSTTPMAGKIVDRDVANVALLFRGGTADNATELEKETVGRVLEGEEFQFFDQFMRLFPQLFQSQINKVDVPLLHLIRAYFTFKHNCSAQEYEQFEVSLLLLYQKLMQLTELKFLGFSLGVQTMIECQAPPSTKADGKDKAAVATATVNFHFNQHVNEIIGRKYQDKFSWVVGQLNAYYQTIASQLLVQNTVDQPPPGDHKQAKGKPTAAMAATMAHFYSIIPFDLYSMIVQTADQQLVCRCAAGVTDYNLQSVADEALGIGFQHQTEQCGDGQQGSGRENTVFLTIGDFGQMHILERANKKCRVKMIVQRQTAPVRSVPLQNAQILFDPPDDLAYAEFSIRNHGVRENTSTILRGFRVVKNLKTPDEIGRYMIQQSMECGCIVTLFDQGDIFSDSMAEVCQNVQAQQLVQIQCRLQFSTERSQRRLEGKSETARFLAQNLGIADQAMVWGGMQRVRLYDCEYDELCHNLLKLKQFQDENQNAAPEKGQKKGEPRQLDFEQVFGQCSVEFVGLQTRDDGKSKK